MTRANVRLYIINSNPSETTQKLKGTEGRKKKDKTKASDKDRLHNHNTRDQHIPLTFCSSSNTVPILGQRYRLLVGGSCRTSWLSLQVTGAARRARCFEIVREKKKWTKNEDAVRLLREFPRAFKSETETRATLKTEVKIVAEPFATIESRRPCDRSVQGLSRPLLLLE